jgi:hypothetical protein
LVEEFRCVVHVALEVSDNEATVEGFCENAGIHEEVFINPCVECKLDVDFDYEALLGQVREK